MIPGFSRSSKCAQGMKIIGFSCRVLLPSISGAILGSIGWGREGDVENLERIGNTIAGHIDPDTS